MKNLLFITSLGLAMVFSNAALAQDVKDGNSAKKETKVNSRSNGKHNANRNFGKDRAATVQQMNNNNTAKIADNKQDKKTPDKKTEQIQEKADKKTEKSVSNEAKKQQKDVGKADKEARKQDKERLKAEKKLMKNSKIK